jgi:uncharacterized protein (DUF58 family)
MKFLVRTPDYFRDLFLGKHDRDDATIDRDLSSGSRTKQWRYNLGTAMKSSRVQTLGAILRRMKSSPVIWRSARPKCVVTIELARWLPVGAFLLVLIWYLAAPTEVAAMGMVALGGLLLCSFLWARAMALGVNGKRALQYLAVQVGDEMEELVTLEDYSELPVLWAEFVDHSNLPGFLVSGVSAADGRSQYQWRARQICLQRGVFILGPWELKLADPFGFFLVSQTYTEHQQVLIHPPLAALPQHLLPHASALGDHRPRRQPLPADTNDVFTTRPYSPGDPLRYVHWRRTAHHNTPFVKVFEPEAAANVWLVPDCDAGSHFGEGETSTEETMVTLTGSLAAYFLREQLAVGLLLNCETLQVIPPQRGTPHLWTLLRALAPLHPYPDHSLAQTLQRAHTIIGVSDSVIVITPSVGADWVRELKQLAWKRRGSGAEAMLLDPASFGGTNRVEPCLALLNELGLDYKVVRRGEIRTIAGAYGALSRWEFMTSATGGAVIKQRPRRAPTLSVQTNVLGHSDQRGETG